MTTKDDCLDALRTAADRLGEAPSKHQYEDLGLTPSASTILRHCGGWNAAKEEAGLHTTTSTGSRTLPKPDHLELPERLVWEDLSQDQRWHYRNREWNTERTLARRQRLRRCIWAIKAESDGCKECTETDPVCLDFHHRESTEKIMAVNKLVAHGYSPDAIHAEIDKCDLLCANCHWKRHNVIDEWENPAVRLFDHHPDQEKARPAVALLDSSLTPLDKAMRLRLWTYAYKLLRRCAHCGEADPTCLQFHHNDPTEKSAGVGELIANSAPTRIVLREVGKCSVLCANCHRKIHHVPPDESIENDRV